MHIHGTSHVHGPHGINAPHHVRSGRAPHGNSPVAPSSDQLDISPAAEAAVRAEESGEIRNDVVARIRSEITAGTYETEAKLDRAVDRLLDEVG